MDTNELPELQLGSRTQDVAAVQQVLDELGYESIDVSTQTDEPEPEPAAEETPAATDSSVPSPEAGGDDAAGDGEGESESTTDSETVETPKNDAPGGKKPKSGYKKKIGKLEQQISELERKLAERSAPAEEPLPDVSAEPEPEPDQDDLDDEGNPRYASESDYFKARVSWSQRESKRQEVLNTRAQREAKAKETADAQAVEDQKAVADRWTEQIELGKSNHDDFEEVFERSKTMHAEITLTEAIQDSDFSAEVIYHLATNPEELNRLNGLLKIEKAGSAVEFRRKLKLAHVEIAALETRILSGSADTETDTDTSNYAAPGSEETPGTDTARESREKAAPVPPAPAAKAAPVATPKKKPEPMRPVGSRGGSTKKRLQDMTRDEVHALDPDDLRKLVGAGN